jgi:hypothetical protein
MLENVEQEYRNSGYKAPGAITVEELCKLLEEAEQDVIAELTIVQEQEATEAEGK